MAYLNSYTPPTPLEVRDWHADTPLEQYNQNFAFALPPNGTLETEGVRLEPLVPSLHAPRLFQLFTACPGGMAFLPYGPFPTYTSFLTFLEERRRRSNCLIFSVYDLGLEFGTEMNPVDERERLRSERIAGIVGLITTPDFRMAELGPLHLADQFHRTHVLTHSVWLLLDWMFSSPFAPATASEIASAPASTASPPAPTPTRGLGLRRAQWGAEHTNLASINGALRIGFSNESPSINWERPLRHESKAGRLGLPEFVKRDPAWREWEEKEVGWGRHSALLGMGWDDWHDTASPAAAQEDNINDDDGGTQRPKGGHREKVWSMVQRGVVRRRAEAVPGLLS